MQPYGDYRATGEARSGSEPRASGAKCRRGILAGWDPLPPSRDVVDLVEEHVSAFNAGDVGRVLEGLTEDVVSHTGSDGFVGLDQVEHLLRDAAGLFPVLEIKSVLVDGQPPLLR